VEFLPLMVHMLSVDTLLFHTKLLRQPSQILRITKESGIPSSVDVDHSNGVRTSMLRLLRVSVVTEQWSVAWEGLIEKRCG
jgi:hypothetical protein